MSRKVCGVVALVLALVQLATAVSPNPYKNARFASLRTKVTVCSSLTGMSGCSGSDAWACLVKGGGKNDWHCVTQQVSPEIYKSALTPKDQTLDFQNCKRCILDTDAMSPRKPFLQTEMALSAQITPCPDCPLPLTDPDKVAPPAPAPVKEKIQQAKTKKWAIAGNLPSSWAPAKRSAPDGRVTPTQFGTLVDEVAKVRVDSFKTSDKLGKVTVECENSLTQALSDSNNPPETTLEEDNSFSMSKLQCPQVPAVYGYATWVYSALNCAMRNKFPGNMVRYARWAEQLEKDILNLPAPSQTVYRAQYIPFDPVANAVYANGNFWSSTKSPSGLSAFLGGRSKLLRWTNVSGGTLPKECVKFAGEEEVLQLPYQCWKVKSIEKAQTVDSVDLGKQVDVVQIEPVSCASSKPTDFW